MAAVPRPEIPGIHYSTTEIRWLDDGGTPDAAPPAIPGIQYSTEDVRWFDGGETPDGAPEAEVAEEITRKKMISLIKRWGLSGDQDEKLVALGMEGESLSKEETEQLVGQIEKGRKEISRKVKIIGERLGSLKKGESKIDQMERSMALGIAQLRRDRVAMEQTLAEMDEEDKTLQCLLDEGDIL